MNKIQTNNIKRRKYKRASYDVNRQRHLFLSYSTNVFYLVS